TISLLLQNLSVEDVNEQDSEGMTALHWAAFHNQPQHVQLLMLKGSDIYNTDIDGKTNGCEPCCSVLIRCQNSGHRLVNIIDSSGKTCVHLAAASGHHKVLKELFDIQGVNFEAGDPDD
ncbi:ankyrin repeat domain-containing protein 55-like, partial [Saccoglossus kowalevskii]